MKNNNRTKVVLSFDDGRKDNYDNVIPILEKYGLTATFNITTAYVDRTIVKNSSPCENPAMNMENVKEMHKLEYEIAAHGDHHLNTIDDILSGRNKLKEWLQLDENARFGFASPNSNLSIEKIYENKEKLRSHFQYIRLGVVDPTNTIKRIVRKFAHITGSRWLYRKGFENTVGKIIDDFIVFSVPVLHNATASQVIELLSWANKNNKHCVLMFHSVLSRSDANWNDTWSWDIDKFQILCQWLAHYGDNYIVCSNMTLMKKEKENNVKHANASIKTTDLS